MTRARMTVIACWLLTLTLLLGGCGRFSQVGQSLWQGDPQLVEVLEQYGAAAQLSPARVTRQIAHLRKAYERDRRDEDLFHLVALALQPGRPGADRRLALDLLEEYRQQARQRADLVALAGLLADQARAQLRLSDELGKARAHAADLEEKLQALENIEKILRQREEGLSPGAEENALP